MHVLFQDLVEKVMVLWKGVDGTSDGLQAGHLANRLYEYASLLASQGCLATALNYLVPVTSDDVCSVVTLFHFTSASQLLLLLLLLLLFSLSQNDINFASAFSVIFVT